MKHDSHRSAILNDKKELREKTAAKSFGEKLRIVEKIRDRDASIRGANNPSRANAGSKKK